MHRKLFHHPGAPASDDLPRESPNHFSLEVLNVPVGECLLLHYGPPTAPRLAIIDGGERFEFERCLLPRLEQLRGKWGSDGVLHIDLVMVTHYDRTSVGGILAFLKHLQQEQAARYSIQRLWFNNFLPLLPKEQRQAVTSKGKETLIGLARSRGVHLNEPFDHFVMPSDVGPAAVTLPGGLRLIVVAPARRRIRGFYRRWAAEQRDKGVDVPWSVPGSQDGLYDPDEHEAGVLSEFASSPDLRLLRPPPVEFATPSGGGSLDKHPANLSSIVVYVEYEGRTMLLTGDARGDDIMEGLHNAWLLTPDAEARVDLLKLPHNGSRRSVFPEFFRKVKAHHYVVGGKAKMFRLPDSETLDMLAEARGESAYLTWFFGLGDGQVRQRVEAFVRHQAQLGRPMQSEFAGEKPSLMIDLLEPVTY